MRRMSAANCGVISTVTPTVALRPRTQVELFMLMVFMAMVRRRRKVTSEVFCLSTTRSRVMDVRGYQRKSEFLTILQSYVANIRRQSVRVTGLHVHVKSDYAKEMTSTTVKAWCAANNVTMSHSAPHEPQENSVAERHVGIIKSVARTIHLHAGFPPNFWFFSVKLAAHFLMFVPPAIFRSVGVSVTPYEVMYGNPPSLLHLRTPGCLVYYYNYTENKKNITDERAKKGVLVGYDDVSRTYKVYSPQHSSCCPHKRSRIH